MDALSQVIDAFRHAEGIKYGRHILLFIFTLRDVIIYGGIREIHLVCYLAAIITSAAYFALCRRMKPRAPPEQCRLAQPCRSRGRSKTRRRPRESRRLQ